MGIDCDMRPHEGYGRFVIEHNFNFRSANQSPAGVSISVSYIGFTTDDELLATLDLFTVCEQQIQLIGCPGIETATYWISLTGNKWLPNQNCRWEMGTVFTLSRGCLMCEIYSVLLDLCNYSACGLNCYTYIHLHTDILKHVNGTHLFVCQRILLFLFPIWKYNFRDLWFVYY